MAKFSFTIPQNERMRPDVLLGDWEVSGTYTNHRDFEIYSIKWDGKEMLPLMDNCSQTYSLFEMVNDATEHHLYEERMEKLQTA